MTTTHHTRKWNAALIIEGEVMPLDLTDVLDLQADVEKEALRVGASLLQRTWESIDFVTIKTTKAHGTVAHGHYSIYWSGRTRKFRAQYMGAASPSVVNAFAA